MRHLVKLVSHENDVKLVKFKGSHEYVDFSYVWSVRFWLLIPEINTSIKEMESLICLSRVNLMLGCLLFKKFKK